MNSKISIVLVATISLLILFFVMNSSSSKIQPQEMDTNNIAFSASDGYQLKGSFWPSTNKTAPALILVHQFNSSRVDYRDLVPILLGEGYSVLSYDTRGFGESKNSKTDINDFPKDIEGALSYIQKRDDVEPSAYGVIGASVGANEAFVASGSIPEIVASVSLSPSNTGVRGVLMGNNINNFAPKNIFIASDEREKGDADVIFAKSSEPKVQKVYPGFGHGIGILKSNDAIDDILAFLKERFE